MPIAKNIWETQPSDRPLKLNLFHLSGIQKILAYPQKTA